MDNAVKQRLMQFIDSKRLSVSRFEQICGLSNSYIRNIRKSISLSTMAKIKAAYPTLNEAWLINGFGEMECNSEPQPAQPMQTGFTTLLVPLSATGGALSDFDEGCMTHQCERISVPIAADLAVPVTGDSMAPEYPDGSIVLVKRVDPSLYIEWGEVYVIDSLNGKVIKEVRQASPTAICCVSRNRPEQYAPFNIELSAVRAMYRVLMVFARK